MLNVYFMVSLLALDALAILEYRYMIQLNDRIKALEGKNKTDA